VLFDRGSVWIDERSVVQPLGTPLRVVAVHVVGATNIE
jgi:hypothetical protein